MAKKKLKKGTTIWDEVLVIPTRQAAKKVQSNYNTVATILNVADPFIPVDIPNLPRMNQKFAKGGTTARRPSKRPPKRAPKRRR